jgi:hypothetical protein
MIEKKGYVFIVTFDNGATPIFGKPLDKKLIESGYENITTNELTFYNEENSMRKALDQYRQNRKSVRKLTPASLTIKLAESRPESEGFRKLTNLVAVQIVKEENYTDIIIYGPINKNFLDLHHGVIPACRIDKNKLLTFKKSQFGDRNFEVAMEARYQLQRQSDNTPTLLGLFKLKRL